MVGYSKDSVMMVASVMDSLGQDIVMSKQKVVSGFYKIILGDFNDLMTHKNDVVSIMFCMLLIKIRREVKYERNTFAYIAENVVIPMLNRALYEQTSTKSALQRPGEVPMLQVMGADSIGKDDLAKVIALIMIQADTDFQDTLVNQAKLEYYIRDKGLFSSKTFVSLEDIVDVSRNYND